MLNKTIFFTIAAFSLGSLGQLFRVSGVNLYLFDIAVLGANLVLLLFLLKKKKFYINSPLIFFLFFSVFTLVVTLFQTSNFLPQERLYVLSFWLRFNLYFGFGYLVFTLIKFGFLTSSNFKKILAFNFYLVTLLNIIQYMGLRDLSFMEMYGFDPHTQRLAGFFLDPNFMGFYLVLYLWINEFYLKNRYLSYISILLLFLTDSRSAFLTLALFLILYLVKNYKKALLLSFFAFLLFFSSNLVYRFNHLSSANDSASLRITSWSNALQIYYQASYFGIGFNNYRNYLIAFNIVAPENYYLNSSNYSDSSLLSVLVFGGVVGLILLVAVYLSYLKNYAKFTLLALIFFNSLIINSLFFPPLAVLIFLALNLEID